MIIVLNKKKYRFKPTIFSTIFFVCIAGLLFSLGIWQLERSEEKKLLSQQISHRLSQPMLEINDKNKEYLTDSELSYRHIKLKGVFNTQAQFFVDNKKHNGRAGYHVITPFTLFDTQRIILINRGWVDAGNSRKILPEILTPSDLITLSGRLSKPEIALYRPGISQPADSLGGVWLYIDLEYFSQLSGKALMPYVLLLNTENTFGYVRTWPEFKANTEMHIGYAIQWFAFSLFSLLAYISIGLKKLD